jgi:hypothetical protein
MFSLFYTHTKTMPIVKPTHFYRTPWIVVKYFFNYFGSKKSVPGGLLRLVPANSPIAWPNPPTFDLQPPHGIQLPIIVSQNSTH